MLIGFDFDSVIIDTGIILCCLLTEHLKTQVCPENINYYHIESNFPELTNQEVRSIINKTCEMPETLATPPICGSFDFLRWYAKRQNIYIITNRADLAPVKAYCQHRMDSYTYGKTVFFSSKNKGQLCRLARITHFIDDSPANIINLANHGIVPMMFIRNWNKKIFSGRENICQLIRFIHSWEDVYSMVNCELENII